MLNLTGGCSGAHVALHMQNPSLFYTKQSLHMCMCELWKLRAQHTGSEMMNCCGFKSPFHRNQVWFAHLCALHKLVNIEILFTYESTDLIEIITFMRPLCLTPCGSSDLCLMYKSHTAESLRGWIWRSALSQGWLATCSRRFSLL